MMKLVHRIKDLEAASRSGPVDIDVELDRAFLTDATEGTGADIEHCGARLRAQLLFQGGNVLATGRVTGRLQAECQRCLGPASVAIDARLHMTYVPRGTILVEDSGTVSVDPDDPDDEDYAHHDGEVVDLGPIVREHILMSMPITLLCKEECQGLCQICGADQNVAPCSCRPAVLLSPLAALKDIKI